MELVQEQAAVESSGTEQVNVNGKEQSQSASETRDDAGADDVEDED